MITKISNPYQDRVYTAKSLFGIIPDEMTLEEVCKERLEKNENFGWYSYYLDNLQCQVLLKEKAQEIFLLAANRQFEGFIIAKTYTVIYYQTYRYIYSDRQTQKVMSRLYALFDLWIQQR